MVVVNKNHTTKDIVVMVHKPPPLRGAPFEKGAVPLTRAFRLSGRDERQPVPYSSMGRWFGFIKRAAGCRPYGSVTRTMPPLQRKLGCIQDTRSFMPSLFSIVSSLASLERFLYFISWFPRRQRTRFFLLIPDLGARSSSLSALANAGLILRS